MPATPTLPAELNPKQFIKDTTDTLSLMRSRGWALKLLDEALKAVWESFHGANEDTRVTLLCDVIHGCHRWLKAKNNQAGEAATGLRKVINNVRNGIADKRRIAVERVGQAALEVLYKVKPSFGNGLRYEENKLKHLAANDLGDKSLAPGFDQERQAYQFNKIGLDKRGDQATVDAAKRK